jgi:hypothetical protein
MEDVITCYGHLVYFTAIWYTVWPFGIFMVIWYIFPVWVCCTKKIWQPWYIPTCVILAQCKQNFWNHQGSPLARIGSHYNCPGNHNYLLKLQKRLSLYSQNTGTAIRKVMKGEKIHISSWWDLNPNRLLHLNLFGYSLIS